MADKDRLIYIRPNKAYKKMKAADEDKITVYIYGVTGTGKTELIRRYLGKRKYLYYDMAGDYTGLLGLGKEAQGQVVVVDNLHELVSGGENEAVKQKIVRLIEQSDIWVILAGRSDIPPWLTVVRYREVFCCIEQAELVWQDMTVGQYLDRTGMVFTDSQRDILIKSCIGLPIAWTITYSDYEQERINDDAVNLRQPLSDERFQAVLQKGFSRMWDYLEYHVYDRWDIELQEFLLDISIVESFNVRLAEMITGRNDVEVLIDRAKWIGNFVFESRQNGEVVYELIDAVKVSMHRRLYRKCSKEKIRTLYENAGLYYQLNSKPLDALRMYETVGDTQRIVSILIDNVRKAANTVYYYELKRYYLELSENTIKKSPELMSGMSMLMSMMLDVNESERWYEELSHYALTHTGSEKRLAMSRLLYLDIALPHRGTEDMAETINKAHSLIADKQVSFCEFSLTGGQASLLNGEKDFCVWSRKDRAAAQEVGGPLERMFGHYGKGLVSMALAESIFEKGGDNYEVAVLANKGRMQAEAGGKIEMCFVADGILSWLHIITGKVSEAVELLQRFYDRAESEGCERILSNIHTFLTRCALYKGDSDAVSKWLLSAPDEEQGFLINDRFHYMTKIRVYIWLGRYEKAYNLLAKCEYYAQVMNRTYISMEVEILKAVILYRTGDESWKTVFKDAFERAQEYGFVRIISREGNGILPLLDEIYHKKDIGVQDNNMAMTAQGADFFKRVLEETRRMAKFYPGYLRQDKEEIVLSETSINIMKLLARGMSKERIANELGMSTANVKYHTQQAYRKLGVSNKTEAVMEAGRLGLI